MANRVTSILASFATLKSLNDAKKYSNSYQLLSEFIEYIIGTKKLFTFTPIEMKNQLDQVFGFDIPEAVVNTATKSLKYVIKNNKSFIVDSSKATLRTDLETAKSDADAKSSSIVNEIVKFIKKKDINKEIDFNILVQELIAVLIDDYQTASTRYTSLIGEYILLHEKDVEIQKCLSDIREGSILYIGLNYNISQTGSLTKPIVLYLDTEVLFNLVGYNGEIYKQLAKDFYLQVRSANANSKKVSLSYFNEVKKEIDDFFASAESIVESKMQTTEKPAMKAIINGCISSSDVKVKKADFYHTLKAAYGILQDEKADYYNANYNQYNLEGIEHSDTQIQEGWKFISHINKLRKGKLFSDNTEAEYLLITNTSNTLKASKEQTEKMKQEHNMEYVNDYAVSIDRITNILWYKLGNGFGRKEYPINVNAVLKAKIILASHISHNVTKIYSETNEQYKKGEITQEQLATRIITLKEKPILPEELNGDIIEESMDFSLEFLSRFEEEVNANKISLQNKEQEIAKKEQEMAHKDELIKKQQEQNQKLERELAAYHASDAKKKGKRDKARRIGLFIFGIFWKIIIIAAIAIIGVICEIKLNTSIPLYICAAIDLVGIGLTIFVAIKKDFRKYFPSDEEIRK